MKSRWGWHPHSSALRRLRTVFHAFVGRIVVVLMRLLRRGERKRTANVMAAALRRLGPWLREHRIARANLVAAFPEKSPQEIEAILSGSWDNLGRVTAEFLHLDRITILDMEKPGDVDVIYDPVTVDRMRAIHQGGARLFFGTHLGNWELPARFAHYYGLDSTVLFRPPNIRPIADAITELRAGCMGTLVPSQFDAPMRMLRALERGGKVGMLVDQYDIRGVDVTFFGRVCKASPLIAQLARHIELPDPWRAHGAPRRPQQVLGRDHRSESSRCASRRQDRRRRQRPRRSPMWSKPGCASTRTSGCGSTAAGGDGVSRRHCEARRAEAGEQKILG